MAWKMASLWVSQTSCFRSSSVAELSNPSKRLAETGILGTSMVHSSRWPAGASFESSPMAPTFWKPRALDVAKLYDWFLVHSLPETLSKEIKSGPTNDQMHKRIIFPFWLTVVEMQRRCRICWMILSPRVQKCKPFRHAACSCSWQILSEKATFGCLLLGSLLWPKRNSIKRLFVECPNDAFYLSSHKCMNWW